MSQIQNLEKSSNETLNEYIDRLYQMKDDNGWNWSDISDILYEYTGELCPQENLRKRYSRYKLSLEEKAKIQEASEINDVLREIRSERYKLADERNQVNADFRRMSREETIKEIAHDFAMQMDSKFLLNPLKIEVDTKKRFKSAILCLSDVHYGLEVNSSFNKYNREIAKERINKLASKVIEYIDKENVMNLIVVNLGDLIA